MTVVFFLGFEGEKRFLREGKNYTPNVDATV